MIAVERAFRCVDGDVVMIDAQAVTLRISVGEEPLCVPKTLSELMT
jgi:hypothetical protein